MDHIQYQIFKIILSIFFTNYSENVDNPSIKIYVNKIENRVTFKVKKRNYQELLTPETMKLLGSTETKITKGKNGENVPHLETVELVLIYCNLVNNKSSARFSNIMYKVWSADQNSRPLDVEDNINLTLIVK